jgi:hypothetical protein
MTNESQVCNHCPLCPNMGQSGHNSGAKRSHSCIKRLNFENRLRLVSSLILEAIPLTNSRRILFCLRINYGINASDRFAPQLTALPTLKKILVYLILDFLIFTPDRHLLFHEIYFWSIKLCS